MRFHPRFVGRYFERYYGLRSLTTKFNQYREDIGLRPVKEKTVHRYNAGKSGYETSVPSSYKQFLISKIS
jgi:hypothetical protein